VDPHAAFRIEVLLVIFQFEFGGAIMQWIQVADAGDIPKREARVFKVGERSIAVFNVGEQLLAIDNRCPLSGCSLAEGTLGGTTVMCPIHGWRICLKTGLVTKPVVEGTPQVRTYPIRVNQGIVFVGVKEEKVAA
jgi:nitrite reductase (NADH) small subunit